MLPSVLRERPDYSGRKPLEFVQISVKIIVCTVQLSNHRGGGEVKRRF